MVQPCHSAPLGGNLRLVSLAAFADNYLWVVDDGQQACAIDPGDAAPVQAWLAQQGLHLSAVLITHQHPDHIGGLTALAAQFADCPVYGPTVPQIAGVTQPLQGGESLSLLGGQLALRVLATPGHTQGHISYYKAAEGATVPYLWCGDTLFSAGCGRIFDGTPAQFWTTLQNLMQLPAATQICCAHEYTLSNLRFAQAIEPQNPALQARQQAAESLRAQGLPTVPMALGEEMRYNPFLRCAEPSVHAAVKHYCALNGTAAPTDDLNVFAALRAWKNVF